MRPANVERDFSLEAKGKATVFFDVEPQLTTPNFNEKIDIKLELTNGEKISKKAELFFRSCPYTSKAVEIDGDLSDWPLDKLCPVKMERIKMKVPGVPSPDDAESNATFYRLFTGLCRSIGRIQK
jgi:hypothetical protein